MKNIKKILITGGAGFIGNSLIQSLPEAIEIVLIDNFHIDTDYKREINKKLQKNRNVRLIESNVSEIHNYIDALKNVDVMVYMASLNVFKESNENPLYYLKENSLYLQIFLDGLQKYSPDIKKVILTSTRGIFGEGPYFCNDCQKRVNPDYAEILKCPECTSVNLIPQKINESDIPNPASYYGITKKLQEDEIKMFCLTRNIPFDLFRIFNVFGEDQGKYYSTIGIVPRMFELIKNKHEVYMAGNGKLIRDFVHINDVVHVIKKSLFNENKREKNLEIYNLGSGKEVSISDLVYFFESLGYKFEKKYLTEFGDIKYSVADNSKVSNIFELKKYSDMFTFLAKSYS